jgi:galactokinase/mevalonate kinase-like predicted kinase
VASGRDATRSCKPYHLFKRVFVVIVSCAPFRVSFAGGGSDIAPFYTKSRGAVLSCTIGKYSFAIIHPFFNASKYYLKYSRTELTDNIDEIQHPLLRESAKRGLSGNIILDCIAFEA